MEEELLKLIVDFYKNLDRQGPGSNDNTRKALSFVDWMDWDSKILDIGCGTGAQTFVLASSLAGHITAVDLYPDFLDVMNMRMRKLHWDIPPSRNLSSLSIAGLKITLPLFYI